MSFARKTVHWTPPIGMAVTVLIILALGLAACKTVIRPPQTIYDMSWDYPGGGGI